ncbi:FUSC family protein [bacterium SCSIO 12844]|nr:FUSC family protein [bacterium SCSIO 12844]
MSGFKELLFKEHSFVNLIVAYRTAFAALVAIIITFYLHIGLSFWAPIAAFAIAANVQEGIVYKSWRRILGTLTGCFAALGFVLIVPPLVWGSVIILILISFMGFYLSKKTTEFYFLLFIVVHMIIIGTSFILSPGDGLMIAKDRIFTNIIGVLCIVIIQLAFFPIKKANKKPQFKIQSTYHALRYALFISISIILAIYLWQLFDIPGGILNMAITILAITQLDSGETVLKGSQRLIGCLIGILFGSLLIFIATYGLFYLLLGFFLISGFFIYYHFQHHKHGYGGLQAAIALSITAFPSLGPTTVITDGLLRALGILIGILITSLMHFIFNNIENLFKLRPQETV